MDFKEQILNTVKASAKKVSELVSALAKYLNVKAEEKNIQMQQQQAYQKVSWINTDIVNCLMCVFQSTPLPTGLQTVLSLTPLYQNQINGNIYDFGYSWNKDTVHVFAQIQINSIKDNLNQTLHCNGCSYTIRQMIDKVSYFEVIIQTTI